MLFLNLRRVIPFFFLFLFVLLLRGRAGAQTPYFTAGNLVVVVEGCGVQGGTAATCTVTNGSGTGTLNSSNGGYGDNQAAPLTILQYAPTGTAGVTYVNSLVLPQNAVGANFPVSGEYGSSSEGSIHLAASGQYVTVAGYGINAATFDASPTTYGAGPSNALAQSGSLTAQSTYTPIARVVALIDAYGNVNTSSALYNIYNTNNPRSTFSLTGTSVYLSGQGSGSDATGGVFYSPLYLTNTAPTAITGLDTSANTLSQDTRDIEIFNNNLYVSVDSKQGSNAARSYVGSLGALPTSLYNNNGGPTELALYNNASTPVAVTSSGKLVLTASEANGISSSGQTVNISPSNFFFANASTMYVADTGNTKQNSGTTLTGDGGLQKWVNTKSDGTGNWLLQYTLSSGLNLVANTASSGTTGLYGLTGVISGSSVYLYATNSTLSDLDTTYLYGFTDTLSSTTKPSGSFTLLATALIDSNFKGVSFVPTLPAGSATLASSPSGLAMTASGTGCVPGNYITPATLVWTQSSSCVLSVTTPVASGGVEYVFSKWQDGTTATSDMVTAPTSSAVYTATFAAASKVVFTAAPAAAITAGGTAGSVQVSVENSAGGVASTSSTTVTLSVAGPGSYLQTYMATTVNGVATFNLANSPALTAAGTYTYTTSSSGLTSAQSIEMVSAGSATVLSVSGLSTFTAPQMAETAMVTAYDSYGNIAQGFTGTVTLSSTDSTATFSPGSYTYTAADAGVHSFTITFNTAGTQTLTATSGSLVGTVTGILVEDSILVLNSNGTLVRLTDAGVQTTAFGTGGSTAGVYGAVAFDHAGDIWTVNSGTNTVQEFSAAGVALGVGGSSGAGVNAPVALALDGLGQVWVANGNNTVSVLSNAGNAVTPSSGYQGGALNAPSGILVDNSGAVWVSNKGSNSVTKFFGAAAPVVTPTVNGTTNNTLGTLP